VTFAAAGVPLHGERQRQLPVLTVVERTGGERSPGIFAGGPMGSGRQPHHFDRDAECSSDACAREPTACGTACGRVSGMTFDDELDRIFAARDRDNMQPTIDALLPLYASHPKNARVLYEVGGSYDTAGQEETAQGFYERALTAGLEGDLLRRCYVQYGSTLRNVGEYEKSCEVFATARSTFPDSPALGAFEAITLHAAGQLDAAVASLLDLVVEFVLTPDIDRYKPAISGNAAYIRSLERHGAELTP
jgi:tetratricopeptide (TPR) repeat protein